MDSLTQIVLGAAVGEAAIGKKVGNWAILWGAIAGTIPDLDVIARQLTDTVTAMEIHRGFSHSIVFSVLMAPVLGWLVSKIYKKYDANWKDWTLLFFLGLFTHPLLDAHTTWGTQLFWPFDYRLAYKNIFVADPLYTVPFLVCVIAVMFYRRGNLKRKKWNNWGLLISSAYMLATIIFKWVAYPKFTQSLKDQEISYLDVKTRPTPLNSILWSANVKTENGYRIGYYSLFDKDENVRFSKEIPSNEELLDPVLHQEKVQQLIKISEGWYVVEKLGDRLLFHDLRFGQDGLDVDNSNFIFSFELGYDRMGSFYAKELPRTMKDGKRLLSELYNRMKGN